MGRGMSRNLLLTLLFVSLGSFVAYLVLRWNAPLPEIEAKGPDTQLTAQYVTLATAVVSLATAILGLVKSTRSRGGDT